MNLVTRAVLIALIGLGTAGCGERESVPTSSPAWQPFPLGTMADLRGVWFTDAQNGWVVGGNYNIPGGLIGRTRDGGKTWRFSSNLIAASAGRAQLQVSAVRFFDAQRGLVATGGGGIFATGDGGENWAPMRVETGRDFLHQFSFVDDERGWAIGQAGLVKTVDGGRQWSGLAPGPGGKPIAGRAIQFLNEQTGWIAGMHASLMQSTDGGATWQPLDVSLATGKAPTLSDIFFLDDQHGWCVGEEGTVLATDDGGAIWRQQRTNQSAQLSSAIAEPGLTLSAVRFVDRDRGWIAAYYPGQGRSVILYTRNGGANWSVEADIAGEELQALFLQGGTALWAVGRRVREGPQAIYRRAISAAPGGAS